MAGKPGVGAVKLEQDVLVTANGCDLLTTIPKYFV
jgi:Xaa-Pro aminopeptidase